MIHPEYAGERLFPNGYAAWVIPLLFGRYRVALGRAADRVTYDHVVGEYPDLPQALAAMAAIQIHHYVMIDRRVRGGN